MNKHHEFLAIEVTGYDRNKKYLYGVIKDGSDRKITLVQNKNIKAGNFTDRLSDESKKSFTPVGSVVVAYDVHAIREESGFYSANYASPLNKNASTHKSFTTPLRIDGKTQLKNGNNGQFEALGATALDAEYNPIHSMDGLRDLIISTLKGNSDVSVPGYARGIMIRIGQKNVNGKKIGMPFEFYAYANETPEAAIERLNTENNGQNKFRSMLKILAAELSKADCLAEVVGLSRVSINSYGDPKNLHKLSASKHYKTTINGQERRAYSLASFTVNNSTGRIDNVLPLPRTNVTNDIAGLVGSHADESAPSFDVKRTKVISTPPTKGAKGYPLRLIREANSTGKLSRIAVKGPRSQIQQFKDRITMAAGDAKPYYRESDNSYIYPAEYFQRVGSSLSDLTGSPAIYIHEQQTRAKSHSIYVYGHIDKAPYKQALEKAATSLNGELKNGAWIFPEESRLQLESLLGETLTKGLNPTSSNYPTQNTPKFPSYSEWQKTKYNASPNALKDAHFDAISAIAEQAGIDWSETSSNIVMPAPNSKQELFKSNASEKNVFVNNTSHVGSASVVAASGVYTKKNDFTGKNEEYLSIYLKFINKKMDAGEGYSEFKSGDYDFSLYEKERGTGELKKPEIDKEEAERRELANQKRLEARTIERREQAVEFKNKALMLWATGTQVTGNEVYISDKGIADYTDLMDLRVGKTEYGNVFTMYQLVDEWGNFAGLQKISDIGWKDKKGKTQNKAFSEGTAFADPLTNQPIGTQGRVGFDDGTSPIIYAEGMADGISAVAASNYFGKIGLNKDNLKKVVAISVHANPDRKHIIIGDNDHSHKKGNVGAMAALDAAWENSAYWMIPNFDKYGNNQSDKDINDLHRRAGLAEVNQQLNSALPPPRNLVEYYNFRLKFETDANYPEALDSAVKEILQRYTNYDEALIRKLLTYTESVKEPQNDTVSSSVSNEETKLEEEHEFPVIIEEKVNSTTGKKYLIINDTSNGLYADPIATAIEECMPGKTAIYNSTIKQYIAPVHLKNILNSKLHSLTGAPANYLGDRYRSSKPGFVIRGDLPESLIGDIQKLLGHIPSKYDPAEQGLVIENPLADTLIKEKFESRLIGQSIPESYDANLREYDSTQIDDEAMEANEQTFNVTSLDIAKMQVLLSIHGDNLVEDSYWFSSIMAKTKKEHEESGIKLPYKSLIEKAFWTAEPILTSDEMTEREFIQKGTLWYQLGEKYKLTKQLEETTQEAPEPANDIIVDEVPIPAPLLEADDTVSTESQQEVTDTPPSLPEVVSTEASITLEQPVPSAPPIVQVEQASMFDILNDNTEASIVSETIEQEKPSSDAAEPTQESASNEADNSTSTEFSDDGADEWEVRIRQLQSAIVLLVENGFTHDEFIDLVESSPSAIGYADSNDQLNQALINSDFHALGKHPIDDLKGFLPHSLSSAYFAVFNEASKARLESYKDYIAEFVYIKGPMGEKTFTKYLNGSQAIPDMVAENPYFMEGELQAEILEGDIAHLTDFKSSNDFYRFHRDLYSPNTNEESAPDSEESQDASQIQVGSEVIDIDVLFEEAGSILYYSSEKEAFYGGDIEGELKSFQLEELKSTTDNEIVMSKITMPSRTVYILNDQGNLKAHGQFDIALSTYRRKEGKLLNLEETPITAPVAQTREQIETTLNAYYDDELSLIEIQNRITQKLGASLDRDALQLLENAFNAKKQDSLPAPLTLDEKLSTLISLASELATTGINYQEFSEEAFRPEGFYYSKNPFLNSQNNVIEKAELNKSLTLAGYKSLKSFYASIYSAINTDVEVDIINQSGSFIPKGKLEKNRSIEGHFSSLLSVINADRLPLDKMVSMPLRDYALTPNALQAVNTIQAIPVTELADEQHLARFTKDDYLFLADLYNVPTNTLDVTKADIADSIIKSWQIRKELTFLSTNEIADCDPATLVEYANTLAIEVDANSLVNAIAIKDKLREIRESSALKLAQYNYVSDAIAIYNDTGSLPAFTYKDIDNIASNQNHGITEAINYNLKKKAYLTSLNQLEDGLDKLNMLTPETRVILNNHDKSKSIVVGIEDAKYASHAFTYSLPENLKVSELSLPIDISYYTYINDHLIGLNRPLENDYLTKYDLAPVSHKAMMKATLPIADFIKENNFVALRNTYGDAVLISETKKGFSALEFYSNTSAIEKSTVKELHTLLEHYRTSGYLFSDIEPLFASFASRKDFSKIEALSTVEALSLEQLSKSDLEEIGGLLTDEVEGTVQEKAAVSLERLRHRLVIDLRESITGSAETYDIAISESYMAVVNKLVSQATIVSASQEAIATPELAFPDIDLPTNALDDITEDTATDEVDLFNFLNENDIEADQEPENLYDDNYVEAEVEESETLQLGDFATTNNYAGVISHIDGLNASLSPSWAYAISQDPEAHSRLFDEASGKFTFLMELDEFATTPNALQVNIDIDLYNPRDPNGLNRIAKMDFSEMKKLASVFGVQAEQLDRAALVEVMVSAIQARTAALLIQTGKSQSLRPEEREALAREINIDDKTEVENFFKSSAQQSKEAILNTNFDAALSEAIQFGYRPEFGQEQISIAPLSEIGKVNDVDVIRLVADNTIGQLLDLDSHEAKFIKHQYINGNEAQIQALEGSQARIQLNGMQHSYLSSNGNEYPSLQLLIDYGLLPEPEVIFNEGEEVIIIGDDDVKIGMIAHSVLSDETEVYITSETDSAPIDIDNVLPYSSANIDARVSHFLGDSSGEVAELKKKIEESVPNAEVLQEWAETKLANHKLQVLLDSYIEDGSNEFLGYSLIINGGKFQYTKNDDTLALCSTIEEAQKAAIQFNKDKLEKETNDEHQDEVRRDELHGTILPRDDSDPQAGAEMGAMDSSENRGDVTSTDSDKGSAGRKPASGGNTGLQQAGSISPTYSNNSEIRSNARPSSPSRRVDYSFPDDLETQIDGVANRIDLNLQALELSNKIEDEGREATLEEKNILSTYSGWGGMPGMFNYSDYKYTTQRHKLTSLVSREEFNSIKESALTAFYTPPRIINQIITGAEKLGFTGGEVSDPSTGTGGFIAAMPAHLKELSSFSARELDTVTARIAQQLLGENVVKVGGYEKSKQPDNYFDLITSNIPFGNFTVYDPEYNKFGYKIHDYFMVKSVDKAKPGGLVAFMTSTGTLDKADSKAREHIYKSADLVAAIRMPSNTFTKYANTNVASDIIFLQKRLPGAKEGNSNWLNTSPHEVEDRAGNFHDHTINQYFLDNPHMVIGDLVSVSTQFGHSLSSQTNEDVVEALAAKINTLSPLSNTAPSNSQPTIRLVEQDEAERITILEDVRPGSYVYINEQLGVASPRYNPDREDYDLIMEPINLTGKKAQRLISAIEVRDKVRQHIEVQMNTEGEPAQFLESQESLRQAYDAYVGKFGVLSSKLTKQTFEEDPDYPLLLGLEAVDKNTQEVVKASIFNERTTGKSMPPQKAETVEDAIFISISMYSEIQPHYISTLLNEDWNSIVEKSGDLLFLEPNTDKWQYKGTYLSGNIANKLADAEAATQFDSYYERNVAALKAVMPERIISEEIKVRLGTVWVPNSVMSKFVEFIVTGEDRPHEAKPNNSFKVSFVNAEWAVQASEYEISKNSGRSRNRYGTSRRDAADLIEKVMNGSKTDVFDTIGGKAVYNSKESIEAAAKAADIANEFKSWIWRDDARKTALEDIYNNRFNVFVNATYDGSHIQYTGLNPTFKGEIFTPRQTQKNTLMRYLVEGRALLAHGVGTGKSFELASLAIEGKARGVHTKPMIGVPNNVFGQLSSMIQEHYPNARILALNPKLMSKDKRKELTARIATGNWDAVIVAHSTLDKFSAPHGFVSEQLQEQKNEFESALAQAEGESGFNNKRAQRKIKTLETKIQKRLAVEKKDDLLYLNELGIDAVFVDEADNFLNLGTPSNMGHVNGVNTQESNRAMNMLFMTRYIQQNNNGRGVVWATGTDIRKSMSDLFVNLYVLAPDELKALGVYEFDNFMSVFGEIVTTIEANPEGTGYRENSRLAKFNNLPELGKLYRSIADVVTAEMAGVIRPTAEKVASKAVGNEYFEAFMQNIGERATAFRNGSKDETWFSIQHDSQRAAMDMRCINPNIPESPTSKLRITADNILKEYAIKDDTIRAQLVFIDRFVNPTQDGFSVYDDLIDKLVAGGIPRDKIVDSRQVSTDAQKKDFEEGMNSGKYLVAIGTTDKFGVGNNIQRNLAAMHEVTPPWNPRDLEQRAGRIERHGNTHKNVTIYRYSTENSFDLFMWETMKRKASFIMQTKLEPELAPREYTEEPDATYTEMMAITTGNSLIKDKIDTDSKLKSLEREYRSYIDNKRQMTNQISYKHKQADVEKNTIEVAEQFLAKLNSNNTIIIDGKEMPDLASAGDRCKTIFAKLKTEGTPPLIVPVGEFHGMPIKFRLEENNDGKKAYRLKIYNEDNKGMLVSNYQHVTQQISDLSTIIDKQTKIISDAKDGIDFIEKSIESLQAEIKQPFLKEEQLSDLTKKSEEINAQLLVAANEASETTAQYDWQSMIDAINNSDDNDSVWAAMG